MFFVLSIMCISTRFDCVKIMKAFSSLHFKSFIAGGLCAGIPLYGLYGYKLLSTTQTKGKQHTSSIIYQKQNDNKQEWELSFKTQLLYKLIHFQFDEIKKSEVIIECLLLSFPLLFTGFLSYRLYLKNISRWKSRHFYNSINVSLNTISPDTFKPSKYMLRVRTILEKDITQIIPNEQGIKELVNAAEQTSQNNPFIIIKDQKRRLSINNLIKDHIVSLSHSAYITEDLLDKNNSIRSKYLMTMTVGPQIQDRGFNKKIRVMLIKKTSIKKLINDIGTNNREEWMKMLQTGFPERWEILYEISKKMEYSKRTRNWSHGLDQLLNEVELAIPLSDAQFKEVKEKGIEQREIEQKEIEQTNMMMINET